MRRAAEYPICMDPYVCEKCVVAVRQLICLSLSRFNIQHDTYIHFLMSSLKRVEFLLRISSENKDELTLFLKFNFSVLTPSSANSFFILIFFFEQLDLKLLEVSTHYKLPEPTSSPLKFDLKLNKFDRILKFGLSCDKTSNKVFFACRT